MKLNLISSAVLAALAVATPVYGADFGLAQANTEQVKWDNWSCKRCTPASGLQGYASAGLGTASVDDSHAGNALAVDDDGMVAVANADLIYWGEDGLLTQFRAQDLGLETGRATLTGSRARDIKAELDFRQWAHYGDTGTTPFIAANNDFSLPAGWVDGATTTQMTALNESLSPVELGLKRDRLSLGLDKYFDNIRTHVALTRQDREGNKGSSATILTNAVNLAEQIDDQTTEISAGLNVVGGKWQFAFGYLGSHYRNELTALRWDNPYTPTFGAAFAGQQAVTPDNDAHQFQVQSTWASGIHVVSGQLVWGRHEQDATFLPATINGPSPALPVNSADLELNKLDFNLRYRARLMPSLALQAELDYEDRDYGDVTDLYPQISSDSITRASETPLSLDKESRSVALSLNYRVTRGIKTELGYGRAEQEWQNQAGDESTEDQLWAKLRLTRWADWNVWMALGVKQRELDTYSGSPNTSGINDPDLRHYYLADRDRQYGKLVARYQLSMPLSVQLTLDASEDDYSDTGVGLTEVERSGYDLHLNWHKDNLTAYAFFNAYQLDTEQKGSALNSVWAGLQQDDARTIGIGAEVAELFDENLSMGLDLAWADSDGDTRVSQGISGDYGDYDATRTTVDLYGRYRLSPESSVQLDLLYQDYEDESYLNSGLAPSTIGNLLSFGDLSHNYNDYLLTVSYRHDF